MIGRYVFIQEIVIYFKHAGFIQVSLTGPYGPVKM